MEESVSTLCITKWFIQRFEGGKRFINENVSWHQETPILVLRRPVALRLSPKNINLWRILHQQNELAVYGKSIRVRKD